MLKKLFKYDMKWINKFMIPFLGITVLCSIVNRFFYELKDISFVFNILYVTTIVVTNGLIINLIFNIIIRNIIRFKSQVYGNESYLVHTLPVKRSDIVVSKILSSALSLLICIFAGIVCFCIEYLNSDIIKIIKDLLTLISSTYDISKIGIILTLILYVILMSIWLTEMLYTSIILGYRSNDKKVLHSFLYAIGLYALTEILNVVFIFMFSLFNRDMLDLFKTNSFTPNLVKPFLILFITINIVYAVMYFIICLKSINKRLNID